MPRFRNRVFEEVPHKKRKKEAVEAAGEGGGGGGSGNSAGFHHDPEDVIENAGAPTEEAPKNESKPILPKKGGKRTKRTRS